MNIIDIRHNVSDLETVLANNPESPVMVTDDDDVLQIIREREPWMEMSAAKAFTEATDLEKANGYGFFSLRIICGRVALFSRFIGFSAANQNGWMLTIMPLGMPEQEVFEFLSGFIGNAAVKDSLRFQFYNDNN